MFGLAVLFGCAASAFGQEKILYYTWARPEVVEEYRPVFDQFEKETGIKVEVQTFAGRTSEYKDSILVNHAAGTGPEVVAVSTHWFEELQAQGVFADLAPYIKADRSVRIRDIFPSSLAAWQSADGRQFALPFDNDIAVLIYNRDLFEQLGTPMPNDQWTWSEWLNAGVRHARDTNGDGLNDFFGMATQWWSSWYSLIWANGGDMFTADGRSNMKSAPVREALQWYAEWFAPKRNLQVNAASQVAHVNFKAPHETFLNGRAAMMPAGVWAVDYTVKSDQGWRFDFGVAPLPKSPRGARATAVEGQGQAVAASARNKEAAYKLVSLMAAEGQRIAARRGQFPVARSIALSNDFLPNWPAAQKATAIQATDYARSLPKGVMWPITREIIVMGAFDYFNGKVALEDALENIDGRLNAKLKELGIGM